MSDHKLAEMRTVARHRLLKVAEVKCAADWEVVFLEGSGSCGIEAVFQTCVPSNGKVAILANGAHGHFIANILHHANIDYEVLESSEEAVADLDMFEHRLVSDSRISCIAAVHCEARTGILNPIAAIGQIAKDHGKIFVVDAINSFGGMAIDLDACHADFLVTLPNRCLEGPAGLCIVLARSGVLTKTSGTASSFCLDLLAQLDGLQAGNPFHTNYSADLLLALDQSLAKLEQEGGVANRSARYRESHSQLMGGMVRLGFESCLRPAVQSHLITAFRSSQYSGNIIDAIGQELAGAGLPVHPGRFHHLPALCIELFGRKFPAAARQLVDSVAAVLPLVKLRPGRSPQPKRPKPATAGADIGTAAMLNLRETNVIRLLEEGLLYKEIADRLGLSMAMVHKIQHQVFVKLGAANRTEASRIWRNGGRRPVPKQ